MGFVRAQRPDERLHGITSDPFSNTYWVHSDRSIFEVLVKDEARDVWRVFLDRGAFATALSHAKVRSRPRRPVLPEQGLKSSRMTDFERPRRRLDRPSRLALLPSQVHPLRSALRAHLQVVRGGRLGVHRPRGEGGVEVILGQSVGTIIQDGACCLPFRLPRWSVAEGFLYGAQDRTERMLLATWLTEIYLGRINELEDLAASETSDDDAGNLRAEQGLIEDELRQFFKTYLVSHRLSPVGNVAEEGW